MDFTLNNFAKTSFNWLFPKKCINCQQLNAQDHHPCCEKCYPLLPFQAHACQQCGQCLAANHDFCGRCIESPPAYDACFCPFEYQPPISDQIQHFKYHQKPELAKSLAQLMAVEINNHQIERPDILIPVPLHISRLRERGYNQSQLLSKSLGQLLDIPSDHQLIEKNKKTPPQAQLSLKERTKNIKRCFKIKKTFPMKTVAIVDDVVTTGTTVNEIAKILKKNGVDYVQVWGIAHTV